MRENLVNVALSLAFQRSEDARCLRELFDTQIQTLDDRGCSRRVIELFKGQEEEVLSRAKGFAPLGKKSLIAFLPVIHRAWMSSLDQMLMVRYGEQSGDIHPDFDPTAIRDVVVPKSPWSMQKKNPAKVPRKPYYLFFVGDGTATVGKSLQEAEAQLRTYPSFPLTEVEVIALAIHTDVLLKHELYAAGSRCGEGKVPHLSLVEGRPLLSLRPIEIGLEDCGVPSCGERVLCKA